MKDICKEIIALIRGRYPLTYIVSFEEDRVEEMLAGIAKELSKRLWLWTVTEGFIDAASGGRQDNTADPLLALDKVLQTPTSGSFLYVLKDFHPFLEPDKPVPVRKLRDAVRHLSRTSSSLFVLSPVLRIPPELEKSTTIVEFPLPSTEELGQLLVAFEEQYGDRASVHLEPSTREAIVRALLGLTQIEAENVLCRALVNDRRLDLADLPLIIKEKEQMIKKSGILEFCPHAERLEDIGGLKELKDWLTRKYHCFSDSARRYGLRTPRGVVLIGVPGCGKSLTAKAVAHAWQMPLLRFDLGKAFGMYVGQSEENMRRAIRTAEAIAPCVLWIDELEKGFAGARATDLDSGVTARVFGTFITWLQEKTSPVYVVATANDVTCIPPELLRKGRFDEIFFVDLPSGQERAEIFSVHIRTRRRDPGKFGFGQLVDATKDYTGADIEAVVDEGLERAFQEEEREPTTQDFLDAIERTLPLSATIPERIDGLRSWARMRTRHASIPWQRVPMRTETRRPNQLRE